MSQASDIADRLIDSQTYSVRYYRAAKADNPPPFKPEILFVQFHKSHVVIVTLKNKGWAEFDPRSDAWEENGVLTMMAEDYYLDIEISSIT